MPQPVGWNFNEQSAKPLELDLQALEKLIDVRTQQRGELFIQYGVQDRKTTHLFSPQKP